MDRLIPSPPIRSYEDAVPIKVGKLRFPVFGASALKKKGILGKAGNYFSREAKTELCLLLKVSSASIGSQKFVPKINEEKFIWTWDSDTTQSIFSFLKTVPEGMCRHTAAQINKEGAIKGSSKGICQRTECIETLTVEDLFPKFLKKARTAKERHDMYLKLIKSFPPTREIVIFDKNHSDLKSNRLVIDGIRKETLRNVLNSNGTAFWVFHVILYTNSKLEEVKNALRPLKLNGSRGNADRGFIMKCIASDDKDLLTGWWKALSVHVEGQTSESIQDTNRDECKLTDILNGLKAAGDESNGLTKYNQEHFSMVRGEGDEAFKQTYKTTLSSEQLMSLLIQTKNASDKRSLDKYLFSSVDKDGLKVIVKPEYKEDTAVDQFGLKKQKLLLQALCEDNLEDRSSFLPESLTNLQFFKMFDFLGGSTNTKKSKETLMRYFDVEKSFAFGDSTKKEFFLSYKPSKNTDCKDKLENNGASTAVLDHLVLHINSLTPSKKFSVNVGGKTIDVNLENFNDLWYSNGGAIKGEARKFADLPNVFSKASTHATEKNLIAYLYEGHRDLAILALLELVELTTVRFFKGELQLNGNVSMMYCLVECIKYCVEMATNAFVISSGLKIFEAILINSLECNALTKQITVQNYLYSSYFETYEKLINSTRFTNIALAEISRALVSFDKMIESFRHKKQIQQSCSIECCLKLMKLGFDLETCTYDETSTHLKAEVNDIIYKLCFDKQVPFLHVYSEQLNIVTKTKVAEFEAEGDTIEFPFILLREVEALQNMDQYEALYNLLGKFQDRKGEYFYKDDYVKLSSEYAPKHIVASPSGCTEETKSCIRTLAGNIDVQVGFTGSEVHNFSVKEKTAIVAKTCKEFIAEVKLVYQATNAPLYILRSKLLNGKDFLKTMIQPNRSELILSARANPARLFGENQIKQRPHLAEQWGEKLLQNFSHGLEAYESC